MDTYNTVLTSPSKNSPRSRKVPAHCLRMMKNFICFSKQFFLQNDFLDTKNAVLTGRPSFPAQLLEIIRTKVHKRCKNFSKIFSSKSSLGGVGSSFKAPLTFYQQLAEIFLLDFQTKVTKCKFCRGKNFSPKISYENENPVLTKTPRFSLQNTGRLSVKVRKRLEE